MGSILASSHQIYLTLLAESTFFEEDIATYFGYAIFGFNFDVKDAYMRSKIFKFSYIITLFETMTTTCCTL